MVLVFSLTKNSRYGLKHNSGKHTSYSLVLLHPNTMNEAIALNNKAVTILRDGGRDVDAVRTLERALHIARDATAAVINGVPSKIMRMAQAANISSPVHHSVAIEAMEDATFFLVDQVLEIRFPRDLTSTALLADDDLVQTCCAIIIYNLAIVHHRRGQLRNEPNHMQKSKSLYELSLKLARQVRCDPSAPSFAAFGYAVFALGAACLNNVAHICKSLGTNEGDAEARGILENLFELFHSCPEPFRQVIRTMPPAVVMGVHFNLYRHFATGANVASAA